MSSKLQVNVTSRKPYRMVRYMFIFGLKLNSHGAIYIQLQVRYRGVLILEMENDIERGFGVAAWCRDWLSCVN